MAVDHNPGIDFMGFRYPVVIALSVGGLLVLRQASRSIDLPRSATVSSDRAEPSAAFQQVVVPFLTKHCYACHGNGKKRGGLALDKYRDELSVRKDPKVWETVLQLVRAGDMPPPERRRPPRAEIERALGAIDAVLAQFDCTGPRNPGRVTVRRLNRAEYNNTIRDLVGIDFQPAADFPADDVGYGFDNIGDVLSLSPLLLEKYLNAAETIVERAVVIADPPQPQRRQLRGALRPTRRAGDVRRGAGVFLHSKGEIAGQNYFQEGDYVIRFQAYGQQVGPEPVRMALRVNGKELKEVDVKATAAEAATYEVKTRLLTGSARLAAAFLNPYTDPKEKDPSKAQRLLFIRSVEVDGPYNPPPPQLPDSHRRIMAHEPGLAPREAAREILTRFAARACRRPVEPDEVARYLKLFDAAQEEGERFEKAVRLALEGILVSPSFLFRIENDPPNAKPGEAYAVNDYELASRLSYFLWSSMPDDELLALAAKGSLKANLDAQVRRMLEDPKSAGLVQNFAAQWLTIRNLQTVSPDPKVFPAFDEELRTAMARETELFFEAVIREDRSVLEFLDADYGFVNGRLAKHYGITGVEGKEFRRVKLPPGRGGILTQASILTITSNPTRTSPVKRGKWVLEQILGATIPPPPPNAGELAEDAKAQLTGSLRQRMEQHRTNPSCAVCHNKMDPIGFGFENFDAVGAWRVKDGPFAIDASGTLPDGRSFRGPAELKKLLASQKDLFGRCLAEKMLTYALGRGLEYYDKCAVDQIVAGLARNDYRFSALVAGVVQSEPFGMRTAKGGK